MFVYDVSNDFYQLWLDRNLVYSCAYFESPDEDIVAAQERKLDYRHHAQLTRGRPGEQTYPGGRSFGSV